LEADLGVGEGVSRLMEASYEVACGNGPEVSVCYFGGAVARLPGIRPLTELL
jgi:hypothetical protein